MNISEKQRYLIEEHRTIVEALRKENLTVKEIYQYYFDPLKNEQTKTLKTVYRYLGLLEKENIVTVAGQRVTEGSRVTEKVYSLSAVYFHHAKPSMDWWSTDESKEFCSKLGFMLAEVLAKPALNQATAVDVIHKLLKLQAETEYFNILDIIETSKKNDDVDTLISEQYFDDRSLITFTSRIIRMMRSLDLIDELKDIADS